MITLKEGLDIEIYVYICRDINDRMVCIDG